RSVERPLRPIRPQPREKIDFACAVHRSDRGALTTGGRNVKTGIVRRALLAAVLALPFAGHAITAHAEGERFVFVSHGPESDSWWNTIKNALKNAEKDLGVTVEYRNPSTGDIAEMARIIEQATASNPTGIISTIADYGVLEAPLKAAIAKGIPVMTVN